MAADSSDVSSVAMGSNLRDGPRNQPPFSPFLSSLLPLPPCLCLLDAPFADLQPLLRSGMSLGQNSDPPHCLVSATPAGPLPSGKELPHGVAPHRRGVPWHIGPSVFSALLPVSPGSTALEHDVSTVDPAGSGASFTCSSLLSFPRWSCGLPCGS